MTMPERQDPDLEAIRRMIENAKPEQIRRLIEDLRALPASGFVH